MDLVENLDCLAGNIGDGVTVAALRNNGCRNVKFGLTTFEAPEVNRSGDVLGCVGSPGVIGDGYILSSFDGGSGRLDAAVGVGGVGRFVGVVGVVVVLEEFLKKRILSGTGAGRGHLTADFFGCFGAFSILNGLTVRTRSQVMSILGSLETANSSGISDSAAGHIANLICSVTHKLFRMLGSGPALAGGHVGDVLGIGRHFFFRAAMRRNF